MVLVNVKRNGVINMLYVIDTQNGFIKENRGLIKNIKEIIHSNYFQEIAFATFHNDGDNLLTKSLDWHGFKNDTKKGREEQIIDKELFPYAKNVFQKTTYSGVTEEFKSFLKKNKIEKVFIVGLYTHTCVLHTVFDLFAIGVQPIIIKEGCWAKEPYHECALKIMRDNFGENVVMSFQEVYREM